MTDEHHRPGTVATHSGQYPIIGADGIPTGEERTVTKGERFPPTPRAGQYYGTPDLTRGRADAQGGG